MVNKRAVSPLIATILLIALTVSIGAMIISWGRQYVQQQTECLDVSATIVNAKLNISGSTITVGFLNKGNQILDTTKVTAILYTADGDIYKCIYYDDDDDVTTNFKGEVPTKLACIIVNPVNETGGGISSVKPGGYVEYALRYDNATIKSEDLQLNAYVQIAYSNCGEISEKFPIS
ncbi:MAG TPA: hypothetical protein EYH22_02835 [Candidatus Nanopusillus sp.]|nr:hypothetical protein [Candidatus Nanopusillus sp.]